MFLRRLAYTVVRLIRFLVLHLEKLIGEVVPDVKRLYFLLILLAYTSTMFRSDPPALYPLFSSSYHWRWVAGFTGDLNRSLVKQLFEADRRLTDRHFRPFSSFGRVLFSVLRSPSNSCLRAGRAGLARELPHFSLTCYAEILYTCRLRVILGGKNDVAL